MQSVYRHLNVVQALIIRDLMARFGRNNLGFVWTILEPMLLCTGVMIVWSLLKTPIVHGVPLVMFVLTGYLPLTLWRHLTQRAARILSNSSGLLYHSPVAQVDIVISKLFLEFLSTTVALIVIYWFIASAGIIGAAGGDAAVAKPGLALAAWLLTGWFSGSVALLMIAWTEHWEPAEKFLQPMQYLFLPVSGCFFMVDWMPSYAQRLLLLNPSVHCYEMFRSGFFGEEIVTHYNPWYLAAWSTAMMLVGTVALYSVRNRIQVN